MRTSRHLTLAASLLAGLGLSAAACTTSTPASERPPRIVGPADDFGDGGAADAQQHEDDAADRWDAADGPPTHDGPLELRTDVLPDASFRRPYSARLAAAGGTPPYGFAVVEGLLPEGLSVDVAGSVVGQPEETGRFPIVVEVTDSADPPASDDASFEVVVPKVILLSGYGPFAGFPVNPSWESVAPLDGLRIGDYEVRTFPIEVVWDVASETFLDRVDSDEPAIAIASGVAGGRNEAFSLERRAFNEEWGTDVEGTRRTGDECVPNGEDWLDTTLPITAMASALAEAGIHAEYSDSAGRYLCNHLFYELLWATQGTDIPAGFIHISDMYATIPELTEGWRVILQAAVEAHDAP